ncbi:10354_t:CDS:1, partial [Ambispora gerdemannii]
MSDCPDLPFTCNGLSECCDRKHGNWLMGSHCKDTSGCGSSFYISCECTSYVKNPGALAGIIIAACA